MPRIQECKACGNDLSRRISTTRYCNVECKKEHRRTGNKAPIDLELLQLYGELAPKLDDLWVCFEHQATIATLESLGGLAYQWANDPKSPISKRDRNALLQHSNGTSWITDPSTVGRVLAKHMDHPDVLAQLSSIAARHKKLRHGRRGVAPRTLFR